MGIKSVEIYRFTATPVYSSVEECTVENLMDFFSVYVIKATHNQHF